MENIIMVAWIIICVSITTAIKTYKSLGGLSYGIKRKNEAVVGGLTAMLIVGLIIYVVHPIKPMSPTIIIPTIMCTVLLLSECGIPPLARYLTRRLTHL